MPIRRLTERRPDMPIGGGLRLAGRIHKGAPSEGNRPGPDLEYFRIELQGAFDSDDARSALNELYGLKPTALHNLYLIGNTPEEAFSSWYEKWGKTGLFQRCDGETISKWYNSSEGCFSVHPLACKCKPEARECGKVGRLMFRLPEWEQRTGLAGGFMLGTHSQVDLGDISQYLFEIERTCQYAEIPFASVPFMLWREPQKFTVAQMKNGKLTGERMGITKHMVKISAEPAFGKMLYAKAEERMRARALAAPAPAQDDDGDLPPLQLESRPARPDWLDDFVMWASGLIYFKTEEQLIDLLTFDHSFSLPAERADAVKAMMDALADSGGSAHSMPLKANAITFHGDELQDYLEFDTVIALRWYGQAADLAKVMDHPELAEMKTGETLVFKSSLVLDWEARSTYNQALFGVVNETK